MFFGQNVRELSPPWGACAKWAGRQNASSREHNVLNWYRLLKLVFYNCSVCFFGGFLCESLKIPRDLGKTCSARFWGHALGYFNTPISTPTASRVQTVVAAALMPQLHVILTRTIFGACLKLTNKNRQIRCWGWKKWQKPENKQSKKRQNLCWDRNKWQESENKPTTTDKSYVGVEKVTEIRK